MEFTYLRPAPPPARNRVPPPPPPTATTATDVTHAGATHEYVPAVVYDCELAAADVVIELLAALAGPVPPGVAPVTLNVYDVLAPRPVTVIGDVPPDPV